MFADAPPHAPAPPPQDAEAPRSGLALLEEARFRIRTLHEAEALAGFLADAFADPGRAERGLRELLVNAVEHGSLEIGHALKGVLLDQNGWRAEVERRQTIEPYASRSVEVVFARRKGGAWVVITDQGPGFDWRAQLAVNPTRAGDRHGRGVARARSICFDALSYNPKGNRAAAFMRARQNLDW